MAETILTYFVLFYSIYLSIYTIAFSPIQNHDISAGYIYKSMSGASSPVDLPRPESARRCAGCAIHEIYDGWVMIEWLARSAQ